MPILIDFSGTVHAGVHVDIRNHNDASKEFLRHIILNQIKAIRKKFVDQYGEPVICMDSGCGYWRKDVFPYYKAKRKEAREASAINWNEVFSYINEIAREIEENLPYKVIRVNKAEADDIIGTLAYKQPWNEESLFGDAERCLIVSNDHDFKQLHGIHGVQQYFPHSRKIERVTKPELFLIEHILKGDSGDGIPNVRSVANVFLLDGVRQTAVTQKYIKEFLTTGTVPECDKARYEENKKLIDLRNVPENIQNNIITQYRNAPHGNRSKLFLYFAQHSLNNHLEHITDF